MGRLHGGPSVRLKEVLGDEVSSLCLVRECEELEESMRSRCREHLEGRGDWVQRDDGGSQEQY